jgi:hypothetical protein
MEATLKYKLSHIFLRVLAAACLLHFLLAEYSQTYYSATNATDPDVRLILLTLLMASTFILPLYVIFEALWMRGEWRGRRRHLLIDAAFAAAWFFTFWGLLFYTVTHTVWL